MTQKEFQKLQKKWYKKLADKGFKDIENSDIPGHPLIHWDSFHFQQMWTPQSFLEKQRYFELAGQMLHDFKFKRKIDKEIWKMHCEGKPAKEISEAVELHTNTINRIIRRYASYIKYDPG
jgi:hypothetical protein